MLNQHSIETITEQTISPSHVRPDYSGYNFANIPGTILNLFHIQASNQLPGGILPGDLSPEKVIFILIDAFGWQHFKTYLDRSVVLQRALREGVVSQLTSQFPSTTTAHVTTLHTNQAIGEHGMYEWYYYEPAADAVISPFFYSYAGDVVPGTLRSADLDPGAIFPRETIYSLLTQHGIASYLLHNRTIAASPYNQVVDKDATHKLSFSNFPQGLDLLSQAVLSATGPAYYYLYWGRFDLLCHTHGPDAEEAGRELKAILQAIEARLLKPLSTQKNTLLLIVADHGQDRINPQRTVYLNHLIPGIERVFRTSKSGQPLVPGGMCKSFFLYIKEEALDETQQMLVPKLDGIAQVLRVSDLIQQGYFGLPISKRFLSRVGNLVIVPKQGESVWWHEPGQFEVGYRGFHGGLTQNEMLIPLLALYL